MKINSLTIQNYCLYLYFFSINYENFNPTGYFSLSKLAGIIYVISAILSARIFLSLNRQQFYFYSPVIIFVVYLTLISLLNINDFSNRFIDIALIQNLLIFMVVVNHIRKDYLVLEKGMLALALGSVSVSILLFLGIGVTELPQDMFGLIVRKTFFNAGPNELAIKLSAGIVIIVSILFENRLKLNKLVRFFLLFSIPLMIISIFDTASRTAFLILPACGLAWFGFKLLASEKKLYALIFGSFLFAIVFIPIYFMVMQIEDFQLLAARLQDTGGGADTSQVGRLTLWLGFSSLIFENPIFGNGYSGFDLITFNYFGFVESPHNVFLEVLMYTGLFGFLFYSIFLSRIFLASYKLFKYRNRILPTILIPIALAFIFILQGLNEKVCWLILAYIIGTYMYNFNKFKDLKY
ncbi:O-antigen ligase family protein [Flavobacteriaceae bacterium]|nr:O-antigen ligase family protein [Flavobacteriaceae bacterium]